MTWNPVILTMCENVIKYIEHLRQHTLKEDQDDSDQESPGLVTDLDFSVVKDFVEVASAIFSPYSPERRV